MCYARPTRLTLDPFRPLLISLAGWLSQQKEEIIDYLEEENRLLREQLGNNQGRLLTSRTANGTQSGDRCFGLRVDYLMDLFMRD